MYNVIMETSDKTNIDKIITVQIETAITELGLDNDLKQVPINFEFPANVEHGDYSTNIAMIGFTHLSPENKTKYNSPRNLAQALVDQISLSKQSKEYIEKIEVAGPGFINFYFNAKIYIDELFKIYNEGDTYGSQKLDKPKKILVEYSSPNIAKRFSIGHLRSTVIGQAIYNLYEFLGWEVVADNHIGDWGTQFGMIIAAIEKDNIDLSTLNIDKLEEIYVDFNKQLESDPSLRKLATDAFVRLENGDANARKIWQTSIDISMKEFDKIYDLLDVKIENVYGESFYENDLKEIIDEAIKKCVARKDQGAYIVEFENMPPAIIKKSDGASTYLTRDLATIKFRRNNPKMKSDIYVYEIGSEQSLHLAQTFKTAEMLGWGSVSDYVHVAHGMITLPEGKMSTRKGNAIKLEELLNKSIEKSKEILKQKDNNYSKDINLESKELEKVSKEIGIGAIKYNDLKHSPSTNYIFSWDEALSMEGNTAPYIQYTISRAKSLLDKHGHTRTYKDSKVQQVLPNKNSRDKSLQDFGLSGNKSILANDSLNSKNLLQTSMTEVTSKFTENITDDVLSKSLLDELLKFNLVLHESAHKFSPNLLCAYLFNLSQEFNVFYSKTKILTEKDPVNKEIYLLLSYSVSQILQNGLRILGIKVPSSM